MERPISSGLFHVANAHFDISYFLLYRVEPSVQRRTKSDSPDLMLLDERRGSNFNQHDLKKLSTCTVPNFEGRGNSALIHIGNISQKSLVDSSSMP